LKAKQSQKLPCGCESLFRDFDFSNITTATPPKRKGVYVIQVKNRTQESPESIAAKAKQLISPIKWKLVEDYVMNRIKRLEKISSCPTIYIGSAGTRRTSKNTRKHRYDELTNRHTIMYPVWALLYAGWKLDYGWKCSGDPSAEEKEYKRKYRDSHHGKDPALVRV